MKLKSLLLGLTLSLATTLAQAADLEWRLGSSVGPQDPTTLALREAEDAVAEITFRRAASVELSPATAYIRRLQHELVSRHGLRSVSKGREPFRRVSVVRESATPNRGLPWRDDDDA